MSIVVGILIGLGVLVLGLLMVINPGDWLVQNMRLPRAATIAIGVLLMIGGVLLGLAIALEWI
jgi:hypothetical protein